MHRSTLVDPFPDSKGTDHHRFRELVLVKGLVSVLGPSLNVMGVLYWVKGHYLGKKCGGLSPSLCPQYFHSPVSPLVMLGDYTGELPTQAGKGIDWLPTCVLLGWHRFPSLPPSCGLCLCWKLTPECGCWPINS